MAIRTLPFFSAEDEFYQVSICCSGGLWALVILPTGKTIATGLESETKARETLAEFILEKNWRPA